MAVQQSKWQLLKTLAATNVTCISALLTQIAVLSTVFHLSPA